MRISDWSSDVCSSDLFPIVGDAVDRKGAVALVELQALGVLPAHLGVRTLVRIVRQALEIEAGSAKFLGLFANAVVDGAADAAAGASARPHGDHFQVGEDRTSGV